MSGLRVLKSYLKDKISSMKHFFLSLSLGMAALAALMRRARVQCVARRAAPRRAAPRGRAGGKQSKNVGKLRSAGDLAFSKGDAKKAEQFFSKVIKLEPKNERNYFKRYRAALRQRNDEHAGTVSELEAAHAARVQELEAAQKTVERRLLQEQQARQAEVRDDTLTLTPILTLSSSLRTASRGQSRPLTRPRAGASRPSRGARRPS